MKIVLFLGVVLSSWMCFAQLNCKTLNGQFGDSLICYHQNKQISTIEYHDKENDRYKRFKAFDAKGNLIFEGGHGYRHGGGSLTVQYYPNGCISSARSTFQPDGGIQYYDMTTFFNEDGTFNRREDNSWDRQVTVPLEIIPTRETPVVNQIQTKDSVQYILKNSSGKKLKILLISTSNPEHRELIVLHKNDEKQLGTFERMKKSNGVYDHFRIEILPRKKIFKTVFISDEKLNSKEKEYLVILHVD